MTRAILCAGVAVIGGVATAAHAENPALNVKTGLWEMTLQLNRLPPIPNDATRLAADQRARLQAMLAAAAHPHTVQTCLTREKLAWSVLAPDDGKACTRTIGSNTARVLDMQLDCKPAEGSLSIRVHIEAPTPDTLTGTTVVTEANRPDITTDVEARRLGDDCGDVN